ncbi:DUF4180 domain-containing protein [Phenylobacterium sp.]|uniref:DUF4180 domain-containing protein n=1 Tax=Phenylobacterium sp. TaxID=1871053 RepID=UPI002BB83E72|nr:DUF4180 domain-containing protein [Phenylobacterium sp.]HVI32742.1 DUF4180 domain-containing protein [Phenylobacterium sp.]
MTDRIVEIDGATVLVCAADGPLLAGDREASDLLGEVLGARAEILAIPVERLPSAFFDLKTRLAGEVLQKFVNYGVRVAIVGDVSAAVARSDALRDFVRESNRGRSVWFVDDLAALEAKLSA